MQRLGRDAKGGQVADVFLGAEGGGQEFDQRIGFRLLPAPDGGAFEAGDGREFQIAEGFGQRAFDAVAKGEREALELGDVEVIGLGGLVEAVAQAKLALVKAEGVGADDGAAKAEDARLCHGVQDRAGGAVGGPEAFGAQNGSADVVEQLGDLELGRGFGLGGQFLDRLARRLQFGFFGRTGDVQVDATDTSGCSTTVTVCMPRSLIGRSSTTCARSTVKPAAVAARPRHAW
jgi:hypothetical protein